MQPIPHRPFRKRRSRHLAELLEQLESRLLLTTYTPALLTALTGGGKNGTGAAPQGLTIAPNGDLYGTAAQGGAHGYGLVFEIAAGTDTVIPLASFSGKDGIYPRGGLVVDANGNVFGTTSGGGTDGKGTIFEVANGSGAITSLVSFTGSNGSFPLAGVISIAGGNLIGTTNGQRSGNSSKSTVFEYDVTDNSLTTLATFKASDDPRGTVVVDPDGNIFGTTRHGGKNADGTLFEVVKGSGTITTLASFAGAIGTLPEGGLIMDNQGDIIGTTVAGGANNNGAAFEWLAGSSTLTLLASFTNAIGIRPHGNLIPDGSGSYFGVTAMGGGHGGGAVYELTPNGTASVLSQIYAFQGTKQGRSPSGPLVIDPLTGDLIGENFSGGPFTGNGNTNTISNRGTLFALVPDTNPQTALKLVITHSPASTLSGHVLAPVLTVEIEDIFGNIVTGDNSTITLQIHSGPTTSTLTGTSMVAAVNGIASFPGISIGAAGTYTLTASESTTAGGTRFSNPSKPFTISPDAANPRLVFSQQPTGTAHSTTITPSISVSVEDPFGNVITTSNPAITLAIATRPDGGAITGSLILNAAHGKATFDGVALTLAGTYTLIASAHNLASVTSDPIIIT